MIPIWKIQEFKNFGKYNYVFLNQKKIERKIE